ncbi:phosphotransferase family protein [Pseudomonas chlororaphis]|uniref:phosphotransferase family protein n=1 Tax=Pseudomonas chlororaphis TaxID=587753 RepID=UPI001BB5E894|nr:phosphotransferase family protein [Pseudomonas chlororaphis]MBP5072415.1 phosphotransferase family protein [Pseudomonas chlororaphis]QTT88401.1 phosphotransferase family protein [Pseudomonas chlororaphis]WDG77654.1 phosphotransferase family protein [Pseudomonas chlororaphis]WDG83109.1 phosphotransferase family protein [Pseudomonas chlororaphis]
MSLRVAHRTMIALGNPGAAALATRIGAGRSSETYLVQANDRDLITYVLPSGSGREAHRRFAVLERIAEHYRLAPKPLAVMDVSDEGLSLLVMERLPGILPTTCVSLTPDTVRRLCVGFISALASLHAIEIAPVDRPPEYLRRSIGDWERRWCEEEAAGAHDDFNAVVRWLTDNLPDQVASAFVHNDFKLDNILVDPGDPARVVGVVDWELATIGHPLADLGIALAYWIERGDSSLLRLDAPGPSCALGAPTRQELVELYAAASGREVPNASYWYVYGLLRLAVITQQLVLRHKDGGPPVPRGQLIVRSLLVHALNTCGSGRL